MIFRFNDQGRVTTGGELRMKTESTDTPRRVAPRRLVAPSVPLKGSDEAIDRVKKLIDEWEETRTGCLERLAEWAMTRTGTTLDEGLDAMRDAGVLEDWRNAKLSDAKLFE